MHTWLSYKPYLVYNSSKLSPPQVSYSGVVDWRSNKDVYISFKEQGQTTADNTSLVIYPLTPSTEYVFKVAAVTSEGQGEEAVVVVTTNKEVGGNVSHLAIIILVQ